MSLNNLRSKLDQQKGQKIQLLSQIENAQLAIKKNKRALRNHEQAREVIREAGLKTQESLSFHISEITSLALEAVFDEPYTLEVDFVQRRNKTECDLFFLRDGERVNPMDASGGGAVDVAAFALRIASWSMSHPRNRNTIILDEPLKNLDEERIEKGSNMLKEVSEKLGIQFIIVTHEKALTSYADKVFEVIIKNGKSIVK
jgi:DNA repair exonuclease SbcCD ATPase subunit